MAQLTSPTLSKLLFSVRNLLNQPNPVNSFWTNAELTEYINEAVRMYFAEVIKNSEGYFLASPVYLNITANQETVALPDDFFEMRALYIQRNNAWEILSYQNNVTSGFYTNAGTSGNSYLPYYYFQGNNIVLHPVPNFSQVGILRLDYMSFPETLVNGGDTLTNQVSPIFKQLIEMYAVYKAKVKESMVNGVVMHEVPKENLNQIYLQFKETINKRSNFPEYIVPFNPESSY